MTGTILSEKGSESIAASRFAQSGFLWYHIYSDLDIVEKGVDMAKCDICGKGVQFGHNVSHSKKATKRQWKPNIQKVTITKGGVTKRINVCAKCLKALSKS